MKRLLLLSGPVAVGKSAVAAVLKEEHRFRSISTGSYLREIVAARTTSGDRTSLQMCGDELDVRTDYRWVIDAVAVPAIEADPEISDWIFDSVRKQRQVEHFRSAFNRCVLHAHLHSADELLRSRYGARLAAGSEYLGNTPFDVAVQHPNEQSARALREVADVVIQVDSLSPREVASQILGTLNARVGSCAK